MDGFDRAKKYEAFIIPERKQKQDGVSDQSSHRPSHGTRSNTVPSFNDDMYYEIEYDSSPFPGVGKFVLKNQKIEAPKTDPVRGVFYQMRDIARGYRYTFDYTSLFRGYYDNALVFYKHG